MRPGMLDDSLHRSQVFSSNVPRSNTLIPKKTILLLLTEIFLTLIKILVQQY